MATFEECQDALNVYPRQLRTRANRVLDAPSARDRNDAVVRFGLDCMKHLAALSFANYRAQETGVPYDAVERTIRAAGGGSTDTGADRSTSGTWKDLFIHAERAAGTSSLFNRSIYSKVKLRAIFEFATLIGSLNDAVSVSAAEVGVLIDRRLAEAQPGMSGKWFAGWDLLVSFRNHCAHDDVYHWLDLLDFYDEATPRLESAVVATFLHPAVTDVLRSAPIWQLTRVRPSGGGFEHSFVEEPLGKNLRQPPVVLPYSLLEHWWTPGWKTRLGSDFLIRQVSGDLNPVPFWDLLAGGIPVPIPLGLDHGSPVAAGQDEEQTTEPTEVQPQASDRSRPRIARPSDGALGQARTEPASEQSAPTRPPEVMAGADVSAPAIALDADATSRLVTRRAAASLTDQFAEQLPTNLGSALKSFLDRCVAVGARVRMDEILKVDLMTQGRTRMLVSLNPTAWYVQLGPDREVPEGPIRLARDRLTAIADLKDTGDYVTFLWTQEGAADCAAFLEAAAAFVEVLCSTPPSEASLSLEEAMSHVLESSPEGALKPAALAAQINEQGLYARSDGRPVRAGQVSARARKHVVLFAVRADVVALRS